MAPDPGPGGEQASPDTRLQTTPDGPAVTIYGNPDYGTLEFNLQPGQVIYIEGGAMAYMDAGMRMRSRLMGGLFKALFRRVLGGESLFVGEYQHDAGGILGVSPAIPGRVCHRALSGETIFLQGGAFLACSPKVHVGTKWGGLRALFGGEGLFFLKCTGHGDLYFAAGGDVIEKDLKGESWIVDTGHVVGWESTVTWRIRGMGNLFSTFFSGEGLVIEFSGQGKVWVQTRTEAGLAGWVAGYLR